MIKELYRKLIFPDLGDERGKLVVAEGGMDIPFDIKSILHIRLGRQRGQGTACEP